MEFGRAPDLAREVRPRKLYIFHKRTKIDIPPPDEYQNPRSLMAHAADQPNPSERPHWRIRQQFTSRFHMFANDRIDGRIAPIARLGDKETHTPNLSERIELWRFITDILEVSESGYACISASGV